MPVTEVTNLADFHKIIGQDTPVIFDFWATWCGPCKQISPIFEELSKSVEGVGFYKVDIDEQTDIAQEVDIRSLPAFMIFKGGNKLDQMVGAYPEELKKLVKTHAGEIKPQETVKI